MASPVFIADFGRQPMSRKVVSFLLPGLLLGLLYYRFVYQPLAEERDLARASYESALKTHTASEASMRRYGELRPEMDKLREQLARNQAALPTEAEVPAFFETLERKVKESGVEIMKWTKRPEEPIESFVKVPVEIEISGTFMQIKRFFASLVQKNIGAGEGASAGGSTGASAGGSAGATTGATDERERERIVSIESLVISQPQVRSREIYLVAKFVAVTFRQDEKAAAGGKPGAPAAPPPLRPRGADPAAGAAGAAGSAGSAAGDPLRRGM
ncbi:MAG TPA: type 4a pilus biogenesis protein PilO [Kofleriaceae bacterium]|nr:type 4a pilus biogenesis protein PilO [Kofleriaceae bacterium]